MTYRDDQAREWAKWSHDRITRQRQQAEDQQRRELADLDESPCSPGTER